MSNRIKELRDQMGMSLADVAAVAGTSNQQISLLEKGRRKLTVEWMKRIAPAFGVEPLELIREPEAGKRIAITGAVQAGLWKQPEDEHEPEWITVPIPEHFIKMRAYALRVRGASMNLVYPEDTILICCHLEDLQEDPQPGKRYIIEDMDPHGQVECTVKEFQRDDDGRPWAWPRSSDPRWQQPVALDNGRNGHTITVRARVVYALRPE